MHDVQTVQGVEAPGDLNQYIPQTSLFSLLDRVIKAPGELQNCTKSVACPVNEGLLVGYNIGGAECTPKSALL